MTFTEFWEKVNLVLTLHKGNKADVFIVYDLTLEDFHNTVFKGIKPEHQIYWLDHNPIPQIKLTYRLTGGTAIDVERHGLDIALIIRQYVTFDKLIDALKDLDYEIDVSYEQENIFILTGGVQPLTLIRSVNLICENLGLECVNNPTGNVNNLRLPSGELVKVYYTNETVYGQRKYGLMVQYPKGGK